MESLSTPLLLSPPVLGLRAEQLASALRDRTFSLPMPHAAQSFLCLLLTSGEAALRGPVDDLSLSAPALLWSPWDGGMRLCLRAGSTGQYALLDGELLTRALGHTTESAALGRLARQRLAAGLADRPGTVADCRQALAVILRELEHSALGSDSLITGNIRALLVHLWRAGGPVDPTPNAPDSTPLHLLQRFRNLVEAQFRRRRKIAGYAEELGLSADRLHDLCRRNLGKSPRQLVQERQMHEARLMLEHSSLTVDQVASALGFVDAAQFSRFFAARAGQPPARYRRSLASRTGPPPASYADWP